MVGVLPTNTPTTFLFTDVFPETLAHSQKGISVEDSVTQSDDLGAKQSKRRKVRHRLPSH